jgi:type IV pilus assembly protein PilP
MTINTSKILIYLVTLILCILISTRTCYAVDAKAVPEVKAQSTPQSTPQASAQSTPQTPSQTTPQVESVPSLNPSVKPTPFVYNSNNKKDPFVSILQLTVKDIAREKKFAHKKGHLSPLEDYDLRIIKILAITQQGNEFIATGQIPDNRTFPIRIGTPIGKQGGIVFKIDLENVIIKEEYFDEKGKKMIIETTIQLGR